MAGITIKDVHVDQALSNFSIGYSPKGFVAEQAIPPLGVKKESDEYYVWDRQSDMQVLQSDGKGSLRADGTQSKEVDWKVSTTSYLAEEYALKAKLTDRQKKNADDVLKLEQSKVKRLKRMLNLDQELRVATLLTTAGNYATGHSATLAGTNQWNYSASDETITIEKDLDTGKEAVRQAIGDDPDLMVIPSAVAKVAKRDSDIRDLIKYTHKTLLVDGDLPNMLWGMRVVIPKVVYTASAEGAATPTYSDVWSDYVVLLWTGAGESSIDEPMFSKIFRSQPWRVTRWRDDSIKGEYIEVSHIQDEVMTSNVSGYLLGDILG